MIFDLVLTILFAILTPIIELIPSFTIWTPTQGDLGGNVNGWDCGWCTQVGAWLSVWDLFFPVALLFIVFGAMLASRIFVGLVQFLRWAWDMLPFKSS